MTVFDTYDKIIENIQQIPLDVYLFIRRNRRLNKKLSKLNRKYKKILKKSYHGEIIDKEELDKIFNKLNKTRVKFRESVDFLQNVLVPIYDRILQITTNELPSINYDKPTIDNINRIVKVGKNKDKGPIYCTCKQRAFDNMIACDNTNCKIKWFHFECAV
ncbi:hypothetical protein P3W45_000350 [Vairimorpha bombi]